MMSGPLHGLRVLHPGRIRADPRATQTFAAAGGHLILALGNDGQFRRFREGARIAESMQARSSSCADIARPLLGRNEG